MENITVQEVPDSYIATQKAPLDKRTLYQTKAEFLAAPENAPGQFTNRFIGQKVVIQEDNGEPAEYWFRDGIADSDLVRCDEYNWEMLTPGTCLNFF
jgi:hypothetical protein